MSDWFKAASLEEEVEADREGKENWTSAEYAGSCVIEITEEGSASEGGKKEANLQLETIQDWSSGKLVRFNRNDAVDQ